MRKLSVILCLCFVALCLAGCGEVEEAPFSAAFTIRPEPTLTSVYFDTSYVGETKMLPDDSLDADALCALFAQAMFGSDGEVAVRWATPVRYALSGSFTSEDAQAAADMATALRHVSGFPDIRETTTDEANVQIRFTDTAQTQFLPETDGAGRILSVQIMIPAASEAAQRTAALQQTMMRACGFFYTVQTPLDSVLRQDLPAAALTEADRILLDALYDGMEAGDAKSVCLDVFAQRQSG